MARSLATLAHGSVKTLSCSPNVENQDEFFSRGAPIDSLFFLGPFFDVTQDLLKKPEYADLNKFDVIFEDTTLPDL